MASKTENVTEGVEPVTYRKSRTWATGPKRPPRPYSLSQGSVQSTSGPYVGSMEMAAFSSGYLRAAGPQAQGVRPSALETLVFEQLNEKAQATYQSMVDAYEGKKTFELLKKLLEAARNPLRGMANALAHAGRKGIRSASAEAWLTWQYGVKPIVYSTYDLLDAWRQDDDTRHISASTLRTYDGSEGVLKPNAPSINCKLKGRYAVRAGATLTVRNPNVRSAQSFGLVNPVEVAWELVPFSFVIDWFLPIGRWASSLSAFAGVTLSNTYVTHFGECYGAKTIRHIKTVNGVSQLVTSTVEDRGIYMRRELRQPRFTIGLEDINLGLGVNQVLTSLSLIQQLRK